MPLRTSRQMTEVLGTSEPNLRVSRQLAELLAGGEANLRVSRQQVEVLLSESRWWRAVTSSLTLSDLAECIVDHNPHVYDTLIFNERLPAIFYSTIEDSLLFVEDAQRVIEGSGSGDLEFIDDAWNFVIVHDFEPTGDYLTCVETVDVECGNWKFVPQSLTFSDTAQWVGPRYQSVAHYLGFAESIWNSGVFRLTVTDLFTLVQIAGRSYYLTISDGLVFSDDGLRRTDAVDSLVLNELVLNGKGGVGSSTLSFTQTVLAQGSFVKHISDLLNIGQSTTYYYITPCIDKQYHPFMGESTVVGQPTAPSASSRFVQQTPGSDRFQLFYPAMGGDTDQIILRAPELDNKDRNAFNRINRETRGGRLVVYADPTWPAVNTISCTFIGLTTVEINLLQAFILNHIGEEIRIIDWEGCGWIGVVLKPNEVATCDGNDRWSIGFEFEGIPLSSYSPGVSMVFTDSVGTTVLRRPVLSDTLVFDQEAVYMVI